LATSNQNNDDTETAEFVSDLLDYAVAMVSNSKSIRYVIDNLIQMEMDFCTTETAEIIGYNIYQYLQSLSTGSTTEATEKEEVEESESADPSNSVDSNNNNTTATAAATTE
jgi:hypothetical protein